ncbi:hypothetical protein [Micromonospora mirobrigensis]|uniref:hypothetical protein n=1 Tax=Micromonospora mirobrigensis TaxID=262898 RepID=UPI000B80A1D2|nr:hypothetical protein [Micromonospora mirobrigensis]
MTTPSGASPDDDYWRRPDPAGPPDSPASGRQRSPGDGTSGEDAGGVPGGPAAAGYTGPPPTSPPPPGWRPPVHIQGTPPRRLPPQDMAALDADEQRAQRVTWGMGAVTGVVLLVLLCLLCSRAFLRG